MGNKEIDIKKEKNTTKKKADSKKKEVKEVAKEFDMSQITPEMMSQMFQMFQQFQNNQPVESRVDIKEVEKSKKFTKADLIDIENEKVKVYSMANSVGWRSPRDNVFYLWQEKGDVEILRIRDILDMKREYLEIPYLKIEDKRVIEALGLEGLYGLIEQVDDVDNLLKLNPDEIKNIFKKLPSKYKRCFADDIYTKVKNGEVRDIIMIKALEEILDINLSQD